MKRTTAVGSLTDWFCYYLSVDTSMWSLGLVLGFDEEEFSIELWIACFTMALHYNRKALREEAYEDSGV